MANFNDPTMRKTGFFHAIGYVLTNLENDPFNEKYKSSHNIKSSEVWADTINYVATLEAAELQAGNGIVTQIGNSTTKALLYPLKDTNRQSWFLDTGTPTFETNGFVPSSGWVKPFISPVDVPDPSGVPSFGFTFKLYRPDGVNISGGAGSWEVDYYAGILKFQQGKTPTDDNNGLGFDFDALAFQSATDPVAFLEAEGPRAIAFQYTGQYLSDVGIGGGGSPLTVRDYNTSATFSNITEITFRGGTVKTVASDTSNAVLATGAGTGKVVVWIPAPDYADNFTPSLFNGQDRKVTQPSSNSYTISSSPGTFDIGNWTAGQTVKATNNTSEVAFSDTEMACLDETTTMDFILYGADNTTVLDSMIGVPINSSTVGLTSSTLGGLSINIQNFVPDADRFKVDVTGTIDFQTILPNGGRFGFLVRHNNSEDENSPYEFTRIDKFSDNDYSPSSADIAGNVTIVEDVALLNYVSGVAFYKQGSTFITSVFDMDNLNDMSYPTSRQLSLDFTNMNTTDKNLLAGADGYVDWTTAWNVENVDFIKSYPTDSNSSIPGLTNDNDLNTANLSKVEAAIYDWNTADTQLSQNYQFMFYDPTSVSDRNTEDFVNEGRRLKVKNALVSGQEVAFDSETDRLDNSASGADWELQQLFGRLVYPKIDFTTWGPNYNSNINYSTLSSPSVSITIYNKLVLASGETAPTQTVNHSGYRWYLRKFETVSLAQGMGTGIFEFDTDFSESDLLTKNDGTSGSGNLLLYMALTPNTFPTAWWDLSKFDNTSPIQGPRTNATGSGSYNIDTNGSIEWNTGSSYPQGTTCYLLVGIKSDQLTKEIKQIDITKGNWA